MSVPFFFAPAPQDSAEGSTPGPGASVRTTDKVRAGDEAPLENRNAVQLGARRYRRGPARTFYDALYDSIAPGIERLLDGVSGRPDPSPLDRVLVRIPEGRFGKVQPFEVLNDEVADEDRTPIPDPLWTVTFRADWECPERDHEDGR